MKRLVLTLVFAFLLAMVVSGHQRVIKLTKEVTQLKVLKTHFYNFRGKVMSTIPMDYLSALTIDDFDFDKYEEKQ